ncbi:FMN-linked oxidoreductase [Lepidopterella palustris CBS 459.81]|uniref:FMN-linked oxidoreductase n=1 Tax=Lepidopterella palustris CBS 459.81 TaxID=1314670 RepID=A0A8E2EC13_9PEZI|nr:FMN-linked oxidoreductase [Lepidopterella palustris CBS 459.81]
MAPSRYESKPADASALGQPLHFTFANRTAPNRFLKASMTERLSSWSPTDYSARGIPSPEVINVYRRWGEGGIGLILTGNIMIEFDQLEAAGNPIIPRTEGFSGKRFEAFKEMGRMAKKEGSLIVGQVSHPGRQCESRIQKDPVSASDVQLGDVMGMSFNKPHPASEEEIQRVIDGFAHAAEYLEKAGYDGIELHGAHGYLIAQFLSRATNNRTDKYGGDIANRSRIIVEIAQAIRKRVSPSFIVGIKLNSVEFEAKGFQPEEAREICKILEANRFDFVELSGGTYEQIAFQHKRESTMKREAFFMEFADSIVPVLKETKTYVTGGFKTVGAMVDALGTIDGIGIARPVCQEPRLCKDILAGKVTGAYKQLFDQDNFGLTNIVAGSQIRQIGRDQEPFDGSDPKNKEAFEKDMGAWMEGMSNDQKFEKYGYVDVNSIQAVPYGTAAV